MNERRFFQHLISLPPIDSAHCRKWGVAGLFFTRTKAVLSTKMGLTILLLTVFLFVLPALTNRSSWVQLANSGANPNEATMQFSKTKSIQAALTLNESNTQEVREEIVSRATQLIGSPYLYTGTGEGGYDCSGLVYSIYSSYIENFPRTASSMAASFPRRPLDQLELGDLVFFATGSDPARVTHVGIYSGNNEMIHSASDGPVTGVLRTPYLKENYWKERLLFAGKAF